MFANQLKMLILLDDVILQLANEAAFGRRQRVALGLHGRGAEQGRSQQQGKCGR